MKPTRISDIPRPGPTEFELRQMLGELIAASMSVVANWEHGDLAGSVHNLDGTVDRICERLKCPTS